MPTSAEDIAGLQSKIWNGSIALEIKLAASDCRTYDNSAPYLVQYPRLSYLAFLLPKIHRFFAPSLINPEVPPHEAWLSFEQVPLKWHYPLGLLYDLLSGAIPLAFEPPAALGRSPGIDASQLVAPGPSENEATNPLPWRLTIHYSDFPAEQLIQLDAAGRAIHDLFINAVKEADFIRNGTARTVMSLSKSDSDDLWLSVRNHNPQLFNSINNKLLNPPGLDLRHIPIRVYLPTSASPVGAADPSSNTIPEESQANPSSTGHMRVVQSLVPLMLAGSRTPQTLGTALNTMLPAIFPSRRSPIYAQPVLHGAVVPLAAPVDGLARAAAYADGFLHIAIVMHG